MNLSHYTELNVQSFDGYKENSYRRNEYSSYIVIKYKTLKMEIAIASAIGAGYGSIAGFYGGSVVAGPLVGAIAGGFGAGLGALGGLINGAINPEEKSYEYYFDKDSGDYLGSNQNEAASVTTTNGVKKFIAGNFDHALNHFNNAFSLSPSGSSEESIAEAYKNVTDSVIKGINFVSNENYINGMNKLNQAYSNAANSSMKSAISKKKNELAEEINTTALNYFQQNNFIKAKELFNHAYELCLNDYVNKAEFKKQIEQTNLVNEGINLVSNGNYTDGKNKLSQIYSSVTNSLMKSAIGKMRNELAEEINTKALNYLEQNNFIKAKELFNHAYELCLNDYANKAEFKKQIEQTNFANEAINLVSNGNYTDGKNKLSQIYSSVTNSSMKSTIKVILNQLAENFNTSALKYFQQENWSLAEEFFDHAVQTKNFIEKNTPNPYENSKNIALNMKSVNSSNEIDKLTEILPRIQNSILYNLVLDMLNIAKGKKLFNEATQNWNEAWNAENDENNDHSSEASKSFNKAKEIFQEASSFVPQNKTYANLLTAISLKIIGNNNFNEAIDLQGKGNELKSKDKYLEAIEKYQSASNYFKEGLAISGDNRFQSNITLTETQIDHVAYIIRSLNCSNLPVMINHSIENVNIEIDTDYIDIDHTIVVA